MKIKGLLISPSTQTIKEVEVEELRDSFLTSMYRLIECDTVDVVRGYFSRQPYCSEDDLWVDDEGLLKTSVVQWGFTLYEDASPIIGNGLVLGVDLKKGDCVSYTLSESAITEIRNRIKWCYCINRHQ